MRNSSAVKGNGRSCALTTDAPPIIFGKRIVVVARSPGQTRAPGNSQAIDQLPFTRTNSIELIIAGRCVQVVACRSDRSEDEWAGVRVVADIPGMHNAIGDGRQRITKSIAIRIQELHGGSLLGYSDRGRSIRARGRSCYGIHIVAGKHRGGIVLPTGHRACTGPVATGLGSASQQYKKILGRGSAANG